MAWCENCGKDNLRKADVEFCNEQKKILCHDCLPADFVYPVEVIDLSPSKFGYAVHLTSQDGLRARFSYGPYSLQFHAPPADLQRLLGG